MGCSVDGSSPSSGTVLRVSSTTRDPLVVAVLFGGRSNEHSVSCVSAGSVLANLDTERFAPVAVGITRDGVWTHVADPSGLTIQDRALPEVDPAGRQVLLRGSCLVDAADGSLVADIDVVFPILHGPYGEDGTVQGVLELAGVPYVGPGVLASAAGMDKEFTKKLFAASGLPIGDQVVLRADMPTVSEADRERLGLPVFVKPARGGSSIGITRVTAWEDLEAAISAARQHDPKVVVEAAIIGREVECGVLQFPDGSVRASEIAEIVMPEAEHDGAFYDFDTKYLDDVCTFELPAKLDARASAELRRLAASAFAALDCKGLARVDFFVTAKGPVINEINTMPGFTAISLYPRMWAETGVEYPELIATLIDSAVASGTGLR